MTIILGPPKNAGNYRAIESSLSAIGGDIAEFDFVSATIEYLRKKPVDPNDKMPTTALDKNGDLCYASWASSKPAPSMAQLLDCFLLLEQSGVNSDNGDVDTGELASAIVKRLANDKTNGGLTCAAPETNAAISELRDALALEFRKTRKEIKESGGDAAVLTAQVVTLRNEREKTNAAIKEILGREIADGGLRNALKKLGRVRGQIAKGKAVVSSLTEAIAELGTAIALAEAERQDLEKLEIPIVKGDDASRGNYLGEISRQLEDLAVLVVGADDTADIYAAGELLSQQITAGMNAIGSVAQDVTSVKSLVSSSSTAEEVVKGIKELIKAGARAGNLDPTKGDNSGKARLTIVTNYSIGIINGGVSYEKTSNGMMTAHPNSSPGWRAGLYERSSPLIHPGEFIEFEFSGPGIYGLSPVESASKWSLGAASWYRTTKGTVAALSGPSVTTLVGAGKWKGSRVRIELTREGFELQTLIDGEYRYAHLVNADHDAPVFPWVIFGSSTSKVSNLRIGKMITNK